MSMEVRAVVDSIGIAIPPEKDFADAGGHQSEVLRLRQAWLVEVCKQTGWRYSPRLHIDLFGNKRGT
jgi:7-carboxy-7-deazaguanine synthase